MSSISRPYVYTDLPQPLDDIEIKEDEDGFQIRLSQSEFLQKHTSSNVVTGSRKKPCNTNNNNNHKAQDKRLSSHRKGSVSQSERCGDDDDADDAAAADDDVEIVDTSNAKRQGKSKSARGMRAESWQRRDNIFERMWLTDNALKKNDSVSIDLPVLRVKEEKTDTNGPYSCLRSATKNVHKGSSEITSAITNNSRISDPNKNKWLTSQSPLPNINMADSFGGGISGPSNDAICIVTEVEPIYTIIISDDDTPDESEELVEQKEDETPNPTTGIENCNLSKFDLIKLRRGQSISNMIDLTDKVSLDNNAKNKGKPRKKSIVKIFRNVDTDEEADDEESDVSGIDSDGTESYDPDEFVDQSSFSDESEDGHIPCPKCDGKFKDISQLKSHMLSHFTEKSYQCKICMRPFDSNAGLKRHIVVHDKHENWKCVKCRKGFSSQRQLDLHISKLHPGFKRFKCDLCRERFDTKVGYEAHMMSHIVDNIRQNTHANQSVVKGSPSTLKQTSKKPTSTTPKNAETKKGDSKRKENKQELEETSGATETDRCKTIKFPNLKTDIALSKQTTLNSAEVSKFSQCTSTTNRQGSMNKNTVPNKRPVKAAQNETQNCVTKHGKGTTLPKGNSSILSKPADINKPSANGIGRKRGTTHSSNGCNTQKPSTLKTNPDSNNNCQDEASNELIDDILPTIKSPALRARGKNTKPSIPKQSAVKKVFKNNTLSSKHLPQTLAKFSSTHEESLDTENKNLLESHTAPVACMTYGQKQESINTEEKQNSASKDLLPNFSEVKEKTPVTQSKESLTSSKAVQISQNEVTTDKSETVAKSCTKTKLMYENQSANLDGSKEIEQSIFAKESTSIPRHSFASEKCLNVLSGEAVHEGSTEIKLPILSASKLQGTRRLKTRPAALPSQECLSDESSGKTTSEYNLTQNEKDDVKEKGHTKEQEKKTVKPLLHLDPSPDKNATNDTSKNILKKVQQKTKQVEARCAKITETVTMPVHTTNRETHARHMVEAESSHMKCPSESVSNDVESLPIVTKSISCTTHTLHGVTEDQITPVSQPSGNVAKTTETRYKIDDGDTKDIKANDCKDEQFVLKVNDFQTSVVSQNQNIPLRDVSTNSKKDPQESIPNKSALDKRAISSVPLKKRFRDTTFDNAIKSAVEIQTDPGVFKSASVFQNNTSIDSKDINASTNKHLDEKESTTDNIANDSEKSPRCNAENVELGETRVREPKERNGDKSLDEEGSTTLYQGDSEIKFPVDTGKEVQTISHENMTDKTSSDGADKRSPHPNIENPFYPVNTEHDVFNEVYNDDLDIESNVTITSEPSSPFEDQVINDVMEFIIKEISDSGENKPEIVDDVNADQGTTDTMKNKKTDDIGSNETNLSNPSNAEVTDEIDHNKCADRNNVTCAEDTSALSTRKSNGMLDKDCLETAAETPKSENKSDGTELIKLEGHENEISGTLGQSAPKTTKYVTQCDQHRDSTTDEVLNNEKESCLPLKLSVAKEDENVSEVLVPLELEVVLEKSDIPQGEMRKYDTRVDQKVLMEGTEMSKEEKNVPALKVAQLLTGLDTKQNKLADVIKELLSNAAHEDKAEVESVLKELGLKKETKKQKIKKVSPKSIKDTSKRQNSVIKPDFQGSIHINRERDQRKSRSRSRSRGPDRDSRRSRSRDRFSTHHLDRRRSPHRNRYRSRSPLSRQRHHRSPDRGHRRSRTPEYRKVRPEYRKYFLHLHTENLNHRHAHFNHMRTYLRSPSHDRPHSGPSFRRHSHSMSRRSISPKRNSRSKDMKCLRDSSRDSQSARHRSHDYDRSPRSSDRSSPHQSKDRHSRRSVDRPGSTYDEESRRSTSSIVRGRSKEFRRSPKNTDTYKEEPKKRSLSTEEKKENGDKLWTSKSWISLSDDASTGASLDAITNMARNVTRDNEPSTQEQTNLGDKEDTCKETDSKKKYEELRRKEEGNIIVQKCSAGADYTTTGATKSELYDPWNLDDDAIYDAKPTEKQTVTKDNNNNTPKLLESEEDKWGKAWYQKKDNKKLKLDTIENGAHKKSVDQIERTVSASKNKEQNKHYILATHNSNNEKIQEIIENDDVFLPVPPPDKPAYTNSSHLPMFKRNRAFPNPLNQNNEKGTGMLQAPEILELNSAKTPENNSKKENSQTVEKESRSLFKSTKSMSKNIFPDFKVTIQNTAQFISVMESPASPDPEKSSSEETPRFAFDSQRKANNHLGPSLKVHVMPMHKSKPTETQIGLNTSGATTKHVHTGNADAGESERNGRVRNTSNTKDDAEKANEKECRPPTPENEKKNPPHSERGLSTTSSDPVKNFNQTLQQLHSTLQQLTKSARTSNLPVNSTAKHQHKNKKIKVVQVKDNHKSFKGVQPKAVSPVKLSDPRKARFMVAHNGKNSGEQMLKDKTVQPSIEKIPNSKSESSSSARIVGTDHDKILSDVTPIRTSLTQKSVEQKNEKQPSGPHLTNIKDQVLSCLKEYLQPDDKMSDQVQKSSIKPQEQYQSNSKENLLQSIDEKLSKIRSECGSATIHKQDSNKGKSATVDNGSKNIPRDQSPKSGTATSDITQAKETSNFNSSGDSTPVHDERDIDESKKKHDENKDKAISPIKEATIVPGKRIIELVKKVTEGESFYLASQQSKIWKETHHDSEKSSWSRSPTEPQSYWTKYPSHERKHDERDEVPDNKSSPRKSSSVDTDQEYKCHECSLTFEEYFLFDVHRVLAHGHGDKKVYTCQICHQRFRYHAELHKHKLTEHNTCFACLDCSETFSTQERLNFHKYRNHGGAKTNEFSRSSDDHSSFKRYQNDHCTESVPSKRYRYSGESKYSSQEKETPCKVVHCPRCPQIFTTSQSLKNHMYARHYRKPGIHRQSFSWKHSNVYSDYYKATDTYRRRKEDSDDDSWSPVRQSRSFTISIQPEEVRSPTKLHSPKRQWFPSPDRDVSPQRTKSDIPVQDIPLPMPKAEDTNKTETEATSCKNDSVGLSLKGALCGKCCPTQEKLNIHLNTHSDPETTEELTASNSTEYKNSNDTDVADDDVNKRQCPICDKILSSVYSKERHMFLHTGEKPYGCTVGGCDRRFIQKSDLMAHFQVHSRQQPGSVQKRCPKCSVTFKYEGNYQKHLSSHEQMGIQIPGIFTCDLCDTTFTSSKALKKHTKKTHSTSTDQDTMSDQLYSDPESELTLKKLCKHCGVKFTDEDIFTKHLLTHQGVNPYRCTVSQCKRVFGDNFALNRHIRTIHKTHKDTKCLKRVCKKCGAMFLTMKAYENHQLVHKGENPYRCFIEDCDKLFSDAIALKRHQVNAHKYSTKNDALRGIRLHCEECGSIFYNSTLLEQHMITHGKHTYTCPDAKCSRKFQDIDDLQGHLQSTLGHGSEVIWKECKQCDEKCLTLHQLEKHKAKIHLKSRVYKCDEPGCKTVYSNLFDLKRHGRSEHNATMQEERQVDSMNISHESKERRTFTCTVCKKSFLSAKSMKIHYSKMHGKKKTFSCEICLMSFTKRETHHIHMMKHKKVNPFKCQICKKTFWLRKERDRHKKEVHASEMSLGCPKCHRKFFDIKALRIHLFKTHDIKITATIVDDKREEHAKENEHELLVNDGAEYETDEI